MKNKFICWCVLIALVFLGLPATALAADNPVGVAYRGHIQDLGDYPADGSWVDSPTIIGTTGQSKRIEGFEIKLTRTIPAGMELRYNVHVQNKGWLYDENDSANWPKDGAYAGTRGESLRIEAVKIVLTDSAGKPVSGYSVQYRGHVQNVGDLPKAADQWLADGAQLGTVGSSQRLEALLVQVVKTTVEPVVYDTAGIYGSATEPQTIAGDVTVAADGVILQNLVIEGNLTISEAVGDGTVTLNNVTVKGDTFVRGGGINSIHINGGQYSRIVMEKTASGAVRIVATDVDGLAVVVAEDATGETIILEGAFASVVVDAPNMTVTTQGNTTTIGKLTVGADAAGATLNLASGTTVTDLVLDGKAAAVKGQGTVTKAEVNADSAVFEKAPSSYAVESDVVIPPVFPSSGGGGGGGTPSKTTLTISDPVITDTKVYDGTTSAVVTVGNLSGEAVGDVGNVTVSATASYDNKNVGTGNKTIRVVYTLGGSAAGKYNKPADFVISTGTITARPLNITTAATVNPTKVYDGSMAAEVTAEGITDAIAGDQLTVKATASYADKNWGLAKPITISYDMSGTSAGNYSKLANDNTTGVITKKQLTFDLTSVETTKEYSGDLYAKASGAFKGVVDNDSVGVIVNAVYDSEDVGDGKTITISYDINGEIDNYLAPAPVYRNNCSITARPLTATGVVVTTEKPYDSTITAVVTTQATVSGAVPGEVVSATASASYNTKDVVTGKTITVNYSLTGDAEVKKNYSAPASYTYTTAGKINTIPISITGVTVNQTKVYDGKTDVEVTNHGSLVGNCAGDVLTWEVTAWYETPDIGSGKAIHDSFKVNGDASPNYTISDTLELGSGEIKPKQLTIASQDLITEKVYDGTTAAAVTNVVLDGVATGETVSVPMATANYGDNTIGTGKTITVVYTIDDASGNYLKPVNDIITTGVIKKDILVYSLNGINWTDTTAANAPVITALPIGTIFGLDNTGAVYAGASDGTVQKYNGSSWSNAFSSSTFPPNFKFAGINRLNGEDSAVGVNLINNSVYENIPSKGLGWKPNGTMIVNPTNYQLLGSYKNAENFYLVYQEGTTLYQYNPYESSPSMMPLAHLSDAVNTALTNGYTICGFNYTNGQINMYLTK